MRSTVLTNRIVKLVADELAATAGEDRGRFVKHARYYRLLLAESHLVPPQSGIQSAFHDRWWAAALACGQAARSIQAGKHVFLRGGPRNDSHENQLFSVVRASSPGQFVFHAPYRLALQAYLNYGVDQLSLSRVAKRRLELEKNPLHGRYHVRNQDNEAGMQRNFAEKLDKVRAVVRDERELILVDPFCQRPVRPAAQSEAVDVRCLEAGGIGQPYYGGSPSRS